MAGKSGGTIGYHYLFTFIAGFGRGPINELREIVVGEETAWSSHACGVGPHVIDAPDLFGGQEKEGGIQGAFHLLQGAPDQMLPAASAVAVGAPVGTVTVPNVAAAMGGLVSNFRGFTALVFDGLVASMNPYLKEWKFRVRRTTAGWSTGVCWYPEKATIYLADGNIHAMNPAHIVYQCLTDPDWGKGEDPAALDENSFVYAANLFCAEGMGLCLPWYRQEDVDSFLQVVADHAGIVLYQDRMTGKYVIRALRDDYDPATIPFFDLDSGLLEIEEDDSASAEAVNEIVLTGFDPRTRKEFQVRAQSTAGWHAQGGPVSRPMEFKGIPTPELGLRKAQQELRLLSAGLKKLRVKFDRRAWQLAPGAAVRISCPPNNIASMVIRLGEITEGTPGSGTIVAKAIEDVFALPTTTFTSAAPSEWTPPIVEPVPAPADRLVEMGYRDLYRLLGPGDLAQADATDAAIGTFARSPGSGSYLYDLATRAQGETAFTITGSRGYTGHATLVAPIGPLDTALSLANLYEIGEGSIGEALMIDDELVRLAAFDPATGVATVARGCADTIPASHAAGAAAWANDDDLVSDGRDYLAGETAYAKVLPRTRSRVLALAAATERTILLVGRQARPYPPANVTVNGVSVYALSGVQANPVIAWAHRDRKLIEDQLVGHTEASVGPEAGTTYTVRIRTLGGALLRETSGIAGTTWTYDATMQAADAAPSIVRVELESRRDALASWQVYSFTVMLNGGWGLGYGYNYGGV